MALDRSAVLDTSQIVVGLSPVPRTADPSPEPLRQSDKSLTTSLQLAPVPDGLPTLQQAEPRQPEFRG